MKQKTTKQEEGKRVRVLGLPELIAEIDSEASDAEGPHPEDVGSAEVPRDAPDRVGSTPIEEVEMKGEEDEEEDNPNVHFKWKQKDKPRKKRVMKKPRRHTPVITER